MIIALMISRKSPSVRMVTGKVSITRTGLTIKLSKLRTMATIIAVVYESTYIPLKSLANNTTARALSRTRRISFIRFSIRLEIKKAPIKVPLKYEFIFYCKYSPVKSNGSTPGRLEPYFALIASTIKLAKSAYPLGEG